MPLQHELRQVQFLSSSHAARMEDMENRLRRNNVRAVGMPEETEGKNPIAFIEWGLWRLLEEMCSPQCLQ